MQNFHASQTFHAPPQVRGGGASTGRGFTATISLTASSEQPMLALSQGVSESHGQLF